MRICLITPGHLSTNPRLVKEADALTGAGHDVTVVAATYQDWSRAADVGFAARPWRRTAPVPFGPSAPRGRRIVQLIRERAARASFAAGLRTPGIASAACHPVGPDLAAMARSAPADLYIAHYIAALPAAAAAARRHGGIYAFDAEDFHTGEFREGARSLGRALTYEVERKWIGGCAWMTAASQGIADAYAEIYGVEKPTVLLNVFPRAEAPATPTACGDFRPGPSVYWFSQTIGPNRGLETALHAAAVAKSQPHLILRGLPAAGFAGVLTELAAELGVAERLHLLPAAPPEQMVRLAASYDLGLSGEPGHTRNNDIALGNKIFTYLLAGVPLIASDTQGHRGVADALAGAAFLYRRDDPQSLAQAMDDVLLDTERLADARGMAHRLGQERFNWEIESTKLIEIVRAHRPVGVRQ